MGRGDIKIMGEPGAQHAMIIIGKRFVVVVSIRDSENQVICGLLAVRDLLGGWFLSRLHLLPEPCQCILLKKNEMVQVGLFEYSKRPTSSDPFVYQLSERLCLHIRWFLFHQKCYTNDASVGTNADMFS
jgi:hypothetical protein